MSQTKKIVTGMWSNNGLGHTAIQKLSDWMKLAAYVM